MTRVLVLGATGMLGHAAAAVLAADGFEVIGSVRDPAAARRHGLSAELVRFDAVDDDAAALLRDVRPDAALNAIGLVKQLPAGRSPQPAIRLNALFPHVLAEACAATGARLVHVSTDCVFSGTLAAPARYGEDDTPDATDVYGRSKLLGEVAAPALTLRTSIIGRELERRSGLLEWFARTEEPSVNGFVRAIFSGVTTTELARFVGRALREHQDLAGLWHLAADPIDKLDLLLRLRGVLGIERAIVPVDEPVINRALDSSRLERATGYRPPDWDTMLGELAATHG
jgi:dTDP-4-dehydrorhamnose reductase